MSQHQSEQEEPQEQPHQQAGQAPLDLVRQQQAELQESKQAQEQNADHKHDAQGQGAPNEKMHHPGRKLP